MKKLLYVMAALAAAGAMSLQAADEPKPEGRPEGGRGPGMNMDKDGDGKVTVAEFASGSSERAKRRFSRADADQDGKVTEAELKAVAQQVAGLPADSDRPRPELPTFAELDANKDGSVTLEEYSAHALAKAEARAKEMDKNGDGVLSKDEVPMFGGPRHQGPPPGGPQGPPPAP